MVSIDDSHHSRRKNTNLNRQFKIERFLSPHQKISISSDNDSEKEVN